MVPLWTKNLFTSYSSENWCSLSYRSSIVSTLLFIFLLLFCSTIHHLSCYSTLIWCFCASMNWLNLKNGIHNSQYVFHWINFILCNVFIMFIAFISDSTKSSERRSCWLDEWKCETKNQVNFMLSHWGNSLAISFWSVVFMCSSIFIWYPIGCCLQCIHLGLLMSWLFNPVDWNSLKYLLL